MATDDKNKDKDQDDFFGDDEDFGLPELDYEALDDDDDSDIQPEEKAEEKEEPVEEAPTKEPELEEPKEEEVQAEDDSVFENESIDDEDIPDQVTDDEIEASFGEDEMDMDDMDDMDDMGMDLDMSDDDDKSGDDDPSTEAMDEFYEEESFDDFEASEMGDGEEISDSVFDSDVLDEDEFAQFEKELMESENEDASDIPSFESDDAPAQSKSKFVKVVVFGIAIFAALGAIFWFMSPMGGEEESKPVAEKPVQKPVERKPVEKAPEEKPETKVASTTPVEQPANNQTKPAPANNRPAKVATNPGTVNELDAKTGNSFIIIGSFLDGDMAMDYANKLAGQGKSPSIIPPFGNAITHRVAIAGYGSLSEALNAVDGFKGEYGQDIWILRY